jgi:hypothetical protein
METSPSDRAVRRIEPRPTAEEAAAIISTLAAFQEEETGMPAPAVSRWTRAGRLEAMGLRVEDGAVRSGWRS